MRFVRICPYCNFLNDSNRFECEECLSDISMVVVSKEEEKSQTINPPGLELIISEDSSIKIENETTIGREGYGETIFRDHLTISRRHAKFQYFSDEKVWKIRDEGSINGTFIDDNKIEPNSWNIVNDGSVISLSSRFKLKTAYRYE